MVSRKEIYSGIIILSVIALISPIMRMSFKKVKVEEMELVEALPTANLFFSNKIVDFGIVPADTILEAHYMLYNVSDNLLKIENVNPDCSCTEYRLSKNIIQPNDSAMLTLILNTNNKVGKYELKTILKANTPGKMYILKMKANILDVCK